MDGNDLTVTVPSPPLSDGEAPRALPAHLDGLAERARGYAEASSSANTRRAYASDWKQFLKWCRRQQIEPAPDPQVVGLYITALASGSAAPGLKPAAVSTIERKLSALAWNFQQLGERLDRADRHIATVLGGIRNTQGRPPVQKEAVLADDLVAMLETLNRGSLRGLRDRAILLIGFAGGLRRSEIVGLDVDREHIVTVARRLSEYSFVDSVYAMTGPFDIIIQLTLPSTTSLHDFLVSELSNLPGIKDSESYMIGRVFKHNGRPYQRSKTEEKTKPKKKEGDHG